MRKRHDPELRCGVLEWLGLPHAAVPRNMDRSLVPLLHSPCVLRFPIYGVLATLALCSEISLWSSASGAASMT